jgi:hypothetical protein
MDTPDFTFLVRLAKIGLVAIGLAIAGMIVGAAFGIVWLCTHLVWK